MVGKRSYRNTLDLIRDVSKRMILPSVPLIATDGFRFYERAIGRVFGPACVYGQVIKTRRNDRVVRVKRKVMIGAGQLNQALRDSEDSEKLNTSFVELLNLTLRQSSGYLGRRSLARLPQLEALRGRKLLITGPTGQKVFTTKSGLVGSGTLEFRVIFGRAGSWILR